MPERQSSSPKLPLGKDFKLVRISKEEMHLAFLHRQATGEPIQTFIRRLIREYWDFEPTTYERDRALRERAPDNHLEEEWEAKGSERLLK